MRPVGKPQNLEGIVESTVVSKRLGAAVPFHDVWTYRRAKVARGVIRRVRRWTTRSACVFLVARIKWITGDEGLRARRPRP